MEYSFDGTATMAAKSGTFDFAKALAGISTKDDHVETATRDDDSDNDSWESCHDHEKTYFNLEADDLMDCNSYGTMSCKAEDFFEKLDRKRKTSALAKTSTKGNHSKTKTSGKDTAKWKVSHLPSHWNIYLSRIEEQQAPKKLTYEEKEKLKKDFKGLPSSAIVELEKAVVKGRQKYMEMCTQDYSKLYRPCEDHPVITVKMMVQYLVENFVERLESEDWEGVVTGIADDPYEDTWFRTIKHTVRALAVHFNVCSKNQVKNIVIGLNLPFLIANKFTTELLHVMLYWIVDPVFGPMLAEIIGEVALEDGCRIYNFLVMPIAEYICPQQKPLLKYKKIRDILVFYLCAELAKSTGKNNSNIEVMKCLVKLDGHESWAIVEDIFVNGRYCSHYGHYTYIDYLEGLNLGVSKDPDSLHKARFERQPDNPIVEKHWKSYEVRRLKLEMQHEENLKDPNYHKMHHCKTEDAEKMFIRVYKFLQKKQEGCKCKKMGEHSGMSSSVIEAVKKLQEGTSNDKVSGTESKGVKEKKSGLTKEAEKLPEKPVANGSSVCPEKVQVKKRKIRECGFCGKLSTPEQKFSKCGSCLHVYYCSRDCQKQHWKSGHKNQCRKK
ncbi:uncharacterized protein [Branchiostoma lanceolatum]|uniref:uncharacterized protein n=1 Tax=Branchiostoma lanceolatum TaxID=7740 RepID=UPI003457259E